MRDSFHRSTRGVTDARGWGITRRAWLKGSGFTDEDLGKPVIGIANTFSELNHCHIHFRGLAEAVKRGVWEAGGMALEFPTISLGEIMISPTTMLYRNLMALEAAVGGPLAAVSSGDVIELDVPSRRLTVEMSEEEMRRRLALWRPPAPAYTRGYGWLYLEHVMQANEGCDFDFCRVGKATGS